MSRLTKDRIKEILQKNEGYKTSTYYEGKNFREERKYRIEGGKLFFRSIGKTSWADSRFDDEYEADEGQVRRFIKKFLDD